VSDKPKALGADLVIPVVALAFTVYFFYSTRELQWEARANGIIIGTLLIVLGTVQIVRVLVDRWRGRATLGFDTLTSPPDALRKRLGMLAITIVFVATLPWLGLGLGIFLAFVAAFRVMEVHGWKHILLVSFIIAAVCSALFTVALDIGLPHGPVESVIAHFAG
jgi:tripartite tricarboxylate transporter TctB family protein